MSENSSRKGSTVKVLGIFAAVAVAIVFAFRWMTNKATAAPPSGGSNISVDPLPNDVAVGGQTGDPSLQFGWVNANDRSGAQSIKAVVTWIRSLTEHFNVDDYAITWQPNMKYSFTLTAKLTDAAGKALAAWGVSMDLFDESHKRISNAKLVTNALGVATAKFEIQPAHAGIYRVRVAAGDAVDQQGIEFRMPANLSMQQAIGG